MISGLINHSGRWIPLFLVLLLSGCASYYEHYGSLESYNSAGESRIFVVSWQTSDSVFFDGSATPIKLTTQCSERELVFKDSDFDPFPCQGDGIVACGSAKLDLDRNGRPVTSDSHVCAFISDEKGANKIVDLGNKIELTISCWPSSTLFEVDGKKKNRDYLRASVVPYTFFIKKVPMNSLEHRVPVPGDRICKLKK
ncbi:MAG: hypothetical protein CSB48_00535 [Proteobacteria bacterium]|nr:MAG: hypothetical protein CSB48_00535 [Pseudomonadota bacterium]